MRTIRARIVLPLGSPPIEGGAVCLHAGRIVAVRNARDLCAGPVEDLGDVILMPGLINAHCHLDYTVMRGAILWQGSFPNWIRRINDLKRILTDDDYLESIASGFTELQSWGTTAVLNIESFPELMVRMPPPPIRTWWFYELLDVRTRVHTEDVVAGALTFFERRPNWLGGFGLSPHSPYTTSLGLYELTKSCCEAHDMPWTTHLAETHEEFEMFLRGAGPLFDFLRGLGRRMDDIGAITPTSRLFANNAVPRDAILVHMNCLTESDYGLLARRARELTVVHCPKCHAYFGRPFFELERFRALGIPVCLGTDSLASNNSLNLFEEMREFRRLHPHVSDHEILDMVTRRPATAIGMHGTLGEITPGAEADLIAIPYDGPTGAAYGAVIENRTPIEWLMVAGRMKEPAPVTR